MKLCCRDGCNPNDPVTAAMRAEPIDVMGAAGVKPLHAKKPWLATNADCGKGGVLNALNHRSTDVNSGRTETG
jgi:hypothetical protein